MTAYTLYFVIGGVVMFLASAIRILREYERGVVFLLGRYWGVKGPGFIIIIPFIQQMVRVDLRTIVMDVPSQDVISRDNVSVHVNAVVYFRVIEPNTARRINSIRRGHVRPPTQRAPAACRWNTCEGQ